MKQSFLSGEPSIKNEFYGSSGKWRVALVRVGEMSLRDDHPLTVSIQIRFELGLEYRGTHIGSQMRKIIRSKVHTVT